MELITKEQIQKAVSVVVDLDKKRRATATALFESDADYLRLYLVLKKAPGTKNHTRIRVPLPHPYLPEDANICLIIKDQTFKRKEDYEGTIKRFKNTLQEHGVTNITEVLSIKQLRAEFREPEAKLKLCKMFDLFLADDRIMAFLPQLLGKSFWKHKKYPMSVKLVSANLKQELDRKISCVMLNIPPVGGNCSVICGKLDDSAPQLIENVSATLKVLQTQFPGGWDNIRSLYLHTSHVTTVPLYVDTGSSNNVKVVRKSAAAQVEAIDDGDGDELSTVPGVRVKVSATGDIQVVRDPDEEDVDEEDVQRFLTNRPRVSFEKTGKRKRRAGKKRKNPSTDKEESEVPCKSKNLSEERHIEDAERKVSKKLAQTKTNEESDVRKWDEESSEEESGFSEEDDNEYNDSDSSEAELHEVKKKKKVLKPVKQGGKIKSTDTPTPKQKQTRSNTGRYFSKTLSKDTVKVSKTSKNQDLQLKTIGNSKKKSKGKH